MKIGMIGTRGHFGYVFESLPSMPDVRVAGVCGGAPGDEAEKLRRWCADHGHAPASFEDYRRMLDEVKPEIAVVDGPFEQHAQMCVEAMRRGIHVFSEKPVATTMRDLLRVQRAYARSGVRFAGMMGLRYDPAFFTAWEHVRGGGIGSVRMIDTRKSYRLGERPAFYRSRATYGGTIPWVGSHALDWVLWFSAERFEWVHAVQSRRDNRGHGELEATALCLCSLSNEVFASASIDFLRPSAAPTHGDDRIRVVGSTGVIEVRGGEVFLIDDGGAKTIPPRCERRIFADFVASVRGESRCLVTAEETIELTRICLLAQQSADAGRPVRTVRRSNG